ncbi:c-type cytochrome [Paraburkholderia edwinii]|uniref:c-type cytochrome n=1 Tax=Paraburkholderia edwinii TaxID=2861782 RepID=UPI003CCE5744
MTNPTSRARPAGEGGSLREQRLLRQRRFQRLYRRKRVMSIATLAAAFSLFALYIAWLEVHGANTARGDESPLAEAVARGPAENAGANGAELVQRGEYLTRAGNCIACHTSDKGRPFAGGVAMQTPFGTIYTPNITPDPDTGIGRWSDADFLRAMHEGIGKGDERLYPAFPYPSYTKVADRDVLAMRAYLNTIAPVRFTPPANALNFPFNQRWLMLFWNLFNFDEGRFVPDPKQSAEWNRGAYLVDGLAHCGECHTPRNFMQGLKSDERFSGAMQAGWHAFNITPDKISGIGNWSAAEVVAYLATGVAQGRASAAGPMAQVVEDSTQFLSGEDLRSIAVYLRALPPVRGGISSEKELARDMHGAPAADVTALRGAAVGDVVGGANGADGGAKDVNGVSHVKRDVSHDGSRNISRNISGAQLFIANCASCHRWTGVGVGASAPGAYPSLIHNSVVGAADTTNLVMVILHGVSRKTQNADILMPSFGDQLTDDQIAELGDYVTNQFGNPHSSVTAKQVAQLRSRPR